MLSIKAVDVWFCRRSNLTSCTLAFSTPLDVLRTSYSIMMAPILQTWNPSCIAAIIYLRFPPVPRILRFCGFLLIGDWAEVDLKYHTNQYTTKLYGLILVIAIMVGTTIWFDILSIVPELSSFQKINILYVEMIARVMKYSKFWKW